MSNIFEQMIKNSRGSTDGVCVSRIDKKISTIDKSVSVFVKTVPITDKVLSMSDNSDKIVSLINKKIDKSITDQ